MNYSLLAWTVVFLSLPSLPSRQVSIDVPREQLNSRETIPAIVANRGKDPVTFCVQFGQTSMASPSGESELTPIPFLVQQYSSGKWGTLMIGPDIGSIRAPVTLGPGKSISYPFRVAANGKIRLLLFYWMGDQPDLSWEHPPKRPSRVESKPLLIADPNDEK
jgi:hypothetical protein